METHRNWRKLLILWYLKPGVVSDSDGGAKNKHELTLTPGQMFTING